MLRNFSNVILSGKTSTISSIAVRSISNLWKTNTPPSNLYHKDRIAKGHLYQDLKYGYEETQFRGKHLPHRKSDMRAISSLPVYKPINHWSEKMCLKGQNDYIDILGGNKIQSFQVNYEIPNWMRGYQGGEYGMLLRRKKAMGEQMKHLRPKKYLHVEKRIKYLYKYLNHRTIDYFWKKDRAHN